MKVMASEWNVFITRSADKKFAPHLLQTTAWGDLKAAFGWNVERIIAGESGAQVMFRLLLPRLGKASPSIAYIPKGPIGNWWEELGPALDALCRQYKAIFVKIEPDLWENQALSIPPLQALKPGIHDIQPPRTVVVDISVSEEQILAQMKQKTRYNVRVAEKNGVVVQPSSDLEAFQALMDVTGSRDRFGVHSLAYYRKAYDLFHREHASSASVEPLCELLMATFEGKPLAALMVFAYGKRSWYLYGASDDAYRNKMPTYLLQWEAIRWARRLGCTEYDLWGIPDEDEATLEAHFTERHDGLWGVYRFKRGFGGEILRAAGPWDRVYNPFLYAFYEWWIKRQERSATF